MVAGNSMLAGLQLHYHNLRSAFTWCSPCALMSKLLSSYKNPQHWSEVLSNQGWPHLKWTTAEPDKVTFTDTEGRDFNIAFGGHSSTYNTCVLVWDRALLPCSGEEGIKLSHFLPRHTTWSLLPRHSHSVRYSSIKWHKGGRHWNFIPTCSRDGLLPSQLS